LRSIAIANPVTKKEATIAGVVFSGVFYCVLTVSERYARREQSGEGESLEQFRVFDNPELDHALLTATNRTAPSRGRSNQG